MSNYRDCNIRIEVADITGEPQTLTKEEVANVTNVLENIYGNHFKAKDMNPILVGDEAVGFEGFVELNEDEEASAYAYFLATVMFHLCPKVGQVLVNIDECNEDSGIYGNAGLDRTEWIPDANDLADIDRTMKAETVVDVVVCYRTGKLLLGHWEELPTRLNGAIEAERAKAKAIEQTKVVFRVCSPKNHIVHVFALEPRIKYPEA